MIGELGGEALRPVAAVCVDVYAVAPPVVQYLVRKRAVQDERQADHTRPEQRERRHAVTRLTNVFHEREFAVRIGAEQAAVEVDEVVHHIKVFVGESGVVLTQQHLLFDGAVAVVFVEGRGDEVDFFLRAWFLPAIMRPRLVIDVTTASALAQCAPTGWHVDLLRKAQQAVVEDGIPSAAAVEIDAGAADVCAACLLVSAEAAVVLLGRQVYFAPIAQRDALLPRRELYGVAGMAG